MPRYFRVHRRRQICRRVMACVARGHAVMVGMALLLVSMSGGQVLAQDAETAWTPPVSVLDPAAGKPMFKSNAVVSDPYGHVHMFWAQYRASDMLPTVWHSRFDGRSWSKPLDLYAGRPGSWIDQVAAAIDPGGNLHVIWTEGLIPNDRPIFHTYAPISAASSAMDWQLPQRIDVHAHLINLVIDARSVLHVVFSVYPQPEPGVYHMRLRPEDARWSLPTRLDSEIPLRYLVNGLQTATDGFDGIHVTWFYANQKPQLPAHSVRYVRSIDGGGAWQRPFTLAQSENKESLVYAFPVIAVSGQTVHIVWAGGIPEKPNLFLRHHRVSLDRGRTWTEASQILGSLNGQAFDSMAVDGQGRVHYFAQIRFPQAVYHTYWEGSRWVEPEVVYMIRQSDRVELEGRIHAHSVHATIRQGNQLVVTFENAPLEDDDAIYFTSRTMAEIPAAQVAPQPQPIATPEATSDIISARRSRMSDPWVYLDPPIAPGREAVDEERLKPTSMATRGPGILWGSLAAAIVILGASVHRLFSR
jgi:hypothetical protein